MLWPSQAVAAIPLLPALRRGTMARGPRPPQPTEAAGTAAQAPRTGPRHPLGTVRTAGVGKAGPAEAAHPLVGDRVPTGTLPRRAASLGTARVPNPAGLISAGSSMLEPARAMAARPGGMLKAGGGREREREGET